MSEQPIIISGASGLIGRALVESLRADGIPVVRLVRRTVRTGDEVEWAPGTAPLDPDVLAGARAVVGLNGASIGRLPWTPKRKRELLSSRLDPTRTLAAAIRGLGGEAPQFVSASAVGFYGSAPGEQLTEGSAAGTTFLAELTASWEAAALEAGTDARVALLRTAPLLHPDGVLKPLVALTRFGLGGPLGGGDQAWPWISLQDEVSAIRHIIDRGLTGPVNLTGPEVASANGIGRAVASALHRPFLLPAPRWALRLALGRDAAESLLLADAAVVPAALEESGFVFAHRTAEEAVAAAIGG